MAAVERRMAVKRREKGTLIPENQLLLFPEATIEGWLMSSDVMTAEETLVFDYELVSSVFSGGALASSDRLADKTLIDPEHLEDALDQVSRLIASRLELMPEKVSEDFETQEILRQKTDQIVANMVLQIRNALEGLTRRHRS